MSNYGTFGDYLRAQTCEVYVPSTVTEPVMATKCGAHADHRQAGKLVCNQHLDNSPNAPRAFATNG